jgi:hypothetical protein
LSNWEGRHRGIAAIDAGFVKTARQGGSGAQIVQSLDDQGVSVRRNPPHDKGTPHIRRITPRPNKSDKSIPSQVARLIRPARGEFYTP